MPDGATWPGRLRDSRERATLTSMSIPLLIGLAVFVIVIAAVMGVWRSRGEGAPAVQSSLMLLAVVAIAALVLLYVLRRAP